MAGKDIITMSQRELKRLHVIQKVVEKVVKQKKAAEVLELSERQVRRIVKRVSEEGETGIIHRLRGRVSHNRVDEKTKKRIKRLCRNKYEGFGPTLASEKLWEIEGIKISDETLRKWLIEEGMWEIRRKRKKHRQWRERKHHVGEMVQMDGSHHDWLEGRGPKLVLMGYIDDASNRVYGRFYKYEGTIPAMDSFMRYIKKYGLPESVYVDKHTTYKSTAEVSIEQELLGKKALSQFQRALGELEVRVIHAHSPQAKGRIERLFRTFQDRLIKEMRLQKIKTIEEANEFLNSYLPKYNKRFNVEPMEEADLHRPIPKGINLKEILSIKEGHGIRNDFTIAHDKKLYQILEYTKASRVEVQEHVDGNMFILTDGKRLRYKPIEQRPKKVITSKRIEIRVKKVSIPTAYHPWRNNLFGKSKRRKSKGKVLI